ncbi:MAG: hypothetical protein CJD30_03635 [Sulfuricurvum sp. PD_MW2]|nr:MAG: hypothetical protein CJD30_03635 [Sulfuricurvum sp. PD_MW2]
MPKTNESGHWEDKQGKWVHPDLIAVDKKLEDETVEKLVDEAKSMQEQLIDFKTKAFETCYSFVELLRQNYGMDRTEGSKLGSVTLRNFNGTKEVIIQVANVFAFDQKLALAKEKIDEYLTEKTEHSDPEIQTLIMRAFEVKNGKVDAKQIIGLKSYDITHPKWVQAMAMIDAATEIAGTKSYIRFRKRHEGVSGELNTIVLDMASLPLKKSGSAA